MPASSIHICTSEAWGGLELYACTVMVEMKNRGENVYAICAPGSKTRSFLQANGIPTFSFPGRMKVSLSSIRILRRLLTENKCSNVHVHFHRDIWNAALAVYNDAAVKLFLSVYMGVTPKNDPLHRFIYRRVNRIFCSNKDLTMRLPRLYGVSPSAVEFLPYGRVLDRYVRDEARRSEIRSRHGIASNILVVGTMVRIDPGKGVLDFVKSFSELDSTLSNGIKYLVVGEPTRKAHAGGDSGSPFERHCVEYLGAIEKHIASQHYQEKIILAGYQDDAIGYLSAMDIFVFPSRDELYSLVVLDAMAMKLPVIAANAGGNLEQITDGANGRLFEVGNSRDLADKISECASSADLRKRLGANGRAFVETTHSMDAMLRKIHSYYNP